MLKMDLHVHSMGVSKCSRVSCEEIIEQKIAMGYDGVVLTNHCQSHYYPPEQHGEYIRSVIEEYRRGKKYAETRSFRFLFGLEVTVVDPFYSDWLLYGVTEEFLLKTPCLYQLSQRELFELCADAGVLLVQAHPYRSGVFYCEDMKPGEKGYLHGLELNCSPSDIPNKDAVLLAAEKLDGVVVCGTDYHGPDRTFRGGTFIPDHIKTSVELAEYLRETDTTTVFMEEEIIEIPNFLKKSKKIKKI